ncbi:MAG TPA: hypothetical protein VIZ28_06860 [Chitinophagaceae bacterium]
MSEDFSHLSDEERLKGENDFLKMKLMLEHGAQFGSNENNELPTELENEFLNKVAAFEKQFEAHKTVKVFDKIGRPEHFKPVNDIPDNEINKAWDELRDHLNKYDIDLDVCSSNITVRELYRFTTEELFDHETDDMDLPGWTTNFIYDEFHPDPIYDNTKTATDHCIKYILQKEPLEWIHNFREENLRLNGLFPLLINEFRDIVNRFKMAYDDLEITELSVINCTVKNKSSAVTGTYSVTASIDTNNHMLSGGWKVALEQIEEAGYWHITEVEIEGISF